MRKKLARVPYQPPQKAGVQRYSWADAAGSYKLLVSPKEVFVDFYAGDSELLSNRFQLR